MWRKGMTLIELLVVVALIGILAVVLVPRLRDQIAKSNDAKAISVLGAMRGSSEAYYADAGNKPYGEILPVGVNNFNQINANDEVGLDLVISGLNQEATSMFRNGGYAVEIGGIREASEGSIFYGGEIGFTFHAPIGSTADGISIWFTERAIGTTDGRYDTKGNRWVEY